MSIYPPALSAYINMSGYLFCSLILQFTWCFYLTKCPPRCELDSSPWIYCLFLDFSFLIGIFFKPTRYNHYFSFHPNYENVNVYVFLERISLILNLYQLSLTVRNNDCFISYSYLSHWSSSLEKVIKIGIIGENLSCSLCNKSSFDLQAILCWSVHITLYLYWIGIDSKLMFDRFSTILKVEQDFCQSSINSVIS